MTIEQTVEIPADYRVFLELPHSIPSGVKAKVRISIPAAVVKSRSDSIFPQSAESEEREIELFRLHADELNAEAEDVLLYQVPIFKDDDP